MQRKTQGKLLATSILFSVLISIPVTNATDTNIAHSEQTISEEYTQHISLQDLITNAPPGSTVHLPGTTTEVLVIDKPLHIRGDGPMRTILQPTSTPNGYALQITAEGVRLSNLTLMNHADGLYTTGLKITAENTTIDHCVFQDTPIGIAIWSSQNTITDCVFHGCTDEGIVLLGTPASACRNNTITACLFTQNCDGIELQHASQTQIISCNFTRNTHAGIDAIESDNNDNIISHCSFTNNEAFGLYLAQSSQNLITECSFSNDTLMLVHATHTTLYKSQIQDIHLLDDSSLVLDQCIGMTTHPIIAEQSTYEIRPSIQEQPHTSQDTSLVRYHQIFLYLQSNLKILKTFIAQGFQAPMERASLTAYQ